MHKESQEMMMFTRFAASACVLSFGASSFALTLPFTEDFAADAASWRDAAGTSTLDWFSSGGVDDGAYASGVFNFVNAQDGDTPITLRGHAAFGSSGGAFVGDWLDEGVSELSFFVRHDVGAPVDFFARLVSSANFPAALAFVGAVPAGEWTQVTIPIDPANPQWESFSGSNFNTIFSNIGNIQIGAIVDGSLAGLDQEFRFDLDRVSIIPSPGGAALLALAGVAGMRRRR